MPDQATQGVMSPFLQRRRIAAALPHLTGRVLDYACGGGALARHVPADRYAGVDIDEGALAAARRDFPTHSFAAEPPVGAVFDTVVALAFIEHVDDPAAYLALFRGLLAPGGRVVMTTPHPAFRLVHDVGARVGVFSGGASEEHEELIGPGRMRALAESSGLEFTRVKRFLGGANQLFILTRPLESA